MAEPHTAFDETGADPDIAMQIKELLVRTMNLDVEPSVIPDDEPLRGELIALDSIGVVQLFVSIESLFGIEFRPDALSREVLRSVRSLACFVAGETGGGAGSRDDKPE